MELPQSLHCQLYLLAWNRQRRRFEFDRANTSWLFDLSLRASMLTDLYLTGHLEDGDGTAVASANSPPQDPLLQNALDGAAGRRWSDAIDRPGRVRDMVRGQLETAGWIRPERPRVLTIFSDPRPAPYDDDVLIRLADRVMQTLHDVIAGRSCAPRLLAVGLIAVQAQLPAVSEIIDYRRDREIVRDLTLSAIEPISVLHEVIQKRFAQFRANLAGG